MLRSLFFAASVVSCATRAPTTQLPSHPCPHPRPHLRAARFVSPPPLDPEPLPASDAAKLPPLTAGAALTPLVVQNHQDAIVSLPVGATGSRPLVLALHGNFDRPEWQCAVWRDVTRGYPFILCPRGVPRRDAPQSLDRWTYGKSGDVRREIDAALAALRDRFGDYIAPGPILYIGFSLGAILGVGIVAGDAERFPRAVLIEGGQSGWTQARAKSYAASGGRRVLFACGQKSCQAEAKGTERLLGRAGLETRSVYGGEVGHAYDGPVADEIARALPWLVRDDPRWSLP